MKELSNGVRLEDIAFGTGVINRFYRNKRLYFKDCFVSILKSVKHLKPDRRMYNDLFIDRILSNAFDAGFRMYDSGRLYGHSEKKIGKLINKKTRREVVLITKVSDVDLERYEGADSVSANLDISLSNFRTDYVDMLLLHFPHGDWLSMYREIEREYERGRARSIGVCNFDVDELKELSANCVIAPMVCQVEMNPLNTKKELLEFCMGNSIAVMAHTPTAHMDKRIASSKIMIELAEKYHKNIGQVIYRWHIQNGVIPIVSTISKDHMKDDLNIFDFNLSESEMIKIDSLNENYTFDKNNNKENDCSNFIYNV